MTQCPEDELTFIVGGDMAALAADVARAGGRPVARHARRRRARGRRARPTSRAPRRRCRRRRPDRFFDMPRLDVSSSLIRRRVAAGQPVRYLVPDAVADYIDARALHRMSAAAARPRRSPPSWPTLIAGYAVRQEGRSTSSSSTCAACSATRTTSSICSGNTDRQTKAIHDRIHEGIKKEHGLLPRRVEGLAEARWILMDYLDVVVHVFTPEAREFYRLEQLWGEAPKRAVGDESS